MSLQKKIKEEPLGGYTSYLRYMNEPCGINAQECDMENLKRLKVSPLYLFVERIRKYFKKY
jgi:hypothetical protein